MSCHPILNFIILKKKKYIERILFFFNFKRVPIRERAWTAKATKGALDYFCSARLKT
jgi:hypothetical protein